MIVRVLGVYESFVFCYLPPEHNRARDNSPITNCFAKKNFKFQYFSDFFSFWKFQLFEGAILIQSLYYYDIIVYRITSKLVSFFLSIQLPVGVVIWVYLNLTVMTLLIGENVLNRYLLLPYEILFFWHLKGLENWPQEYPPHKMLFKTVFLQSMPMPVGREGSKRKDRIPSF